MHYRVTTATNRKLKPGELYLVDSGAQYLDGTTDVTRTVAIGKPTREMQERFTLVLKGHIAIATARFPKGTRGIDLDPFARRALWEAGLDFDHGTGHGVGSYLSVHEGPQSISKGGMAALEPGMIISNEPGYYKTGAYGIRIENLVLVTEPEKVAGGEREMMSFETLTLVPIDRRLVVRGDAVGRPSSTGSTPTTGACARSSGRSWGRRIASGWRQATAMIRMPVVIPEIAQRISVPRASGLKLKDRPSFPLPTSCGLSGRPRNEHAEFWAARHPGRLARLRGRA